MSTGLEFGLFVFLLLLFVIVLSYCHDLVEGHEHLFQYRWQTLHLRLCRYLFFAHLYPYLVLFLLCSSLLDQQWGPVLPLAPS